MVLKTSCFSIFWSWMAIWWFEWSWHKVLVGEPAGGLFFFPLFFFFQLIVNVFMDFLANFFNFFNYKIFSADELISLLLFYNFFKLLFWSSMVELIWPTQFFNRKNNIFFKSLRYRTYVEFIAKLKIVNFSYWNMNRAFIKYLFIKK